MMLAGENQPLHPDLLGRLYDLFCVECSGIEQLLILVTVSPLFIVKGVHVKMNKPVEFQCVPLELRCGWNGVEWL